MFPEEVKDISDSTDRWEGWFGSTGLYNDKSWDNI